MILSLIVAHDRNGLIGVGGALPWRIPAELARFREVTIGAGNNAVIMGRRTWESIGRPLMGRFGIVLSREDFFVANAKGARTLPDAFAFAEAIGCDEAIVIGGASVYAEAFPMIHRAYVTTIAAAYAFEGGVYLPACDRPYRVTERFDVAATDTTPAWSAETWEF